MKNCFSFFASFIFCYVLFAFPTNAYAYLDPGTGSMLLSVLAGVLSSVFFNVRKLPILARSLLFRLSGQDAQIKKTSIVMYAESATYWNTFKPLLEECGKRRVAVQYLTSDKKDPVFEDTLPECITARYIGTGNKAYMLLNFLEADVFVLTTPGIDVLQIRRSKGVGKYIHVLHAPTDIHTYKLFSFDYYDEVICCNLAQIHSLRALEKVRNIKAKRLSVLGCLYYDVQNKRHETEHTKADQNCVIVAPTWGKNGMLTRTGSVIPKVLAEAGYKVILRPHPQSFVSEIDLINKLQQELSSYPNIIWDQEPDGFVSMQKAEIMISDMVSGIKFDFAFIFLRPTITIDADFDEDGFESFDISHPQFELELAEKLGQCLKIDEVDQLPKIVDTILRNREKKAAYIERLREQYVVNYGHAAGPIVDEICHMVEVADRDKRRLR